jgi:TonB family protein
MRFSRLFAFSVVSLLASNIQSATQAQDQTLPKKQDITGTPIPRPKIISAPTAPYPDEALKKNIEGKVVLSIVVDGKGQVSDAKALSGPPELIPAAIDSVKRWQFEPPTHAPLVTTVEISYGHPKECPGAVSDAGEVRATSWLENRDGKVIATPDDYDSSLPPYFEEDRKAGVAGDMVLGLTLDSEGRVKEIHVVKSLSARLDDAAIKTVRTWKFKLVDGNTGKPPEDLQLHILYRPTCMPQF